MAEVVHHPQPRRATTRAANLADGLEHRSNLRVAVSGPLHGVAVDPEREIVEEQTAVHLCDIDLALDRIGERVERANEIVSIDAEVEREVVPCPGGDAHERKPGLQRHGRDDGQRPVAPGDAERVRVPSSTCSAAIAARSAPGPRVTASIPRS